MTNGEARVGHKTYLKQESFFLFSFLFMNVDTRAHWDLGGIQKKNQVHEKCAAFQSKAFLVTAYSITLDWTAGNIL